MTIGRGLNRGSHPSIQWQVWIAVNRLQEIQVLLGFGRLSEAALASKQDSRQSRARVAFLW